jgi:hypothetical protein
MVARPGARAGPFLRLRRLTPKLEVLIVEESPPIELSGCPASQQSTGLDIVQDLADRFPLARPNTRV